VIGISFLLAPFAFENTQRLIKAETRDEKAAIWIESFAQAL
jgi:hypothetical protein